MLLVPSFVLLSALALSNAAPEPYKIACSLLKAKYPDITFFPGNADYTYETRTRMSYASTNFKDPGCVFAAKDANGMAFAVKTLSGTRTKFAVLGGGHMPIAGSNSIDAPGVLLSTSHLQQKSLNADKSVATIGAGLRWTEVYNFLQPYSRIVLGGREPYIGVPGLLLGGGLSFYSSQHGFASDNVEKFECVLANGAIASVTPTNVHSDLYWALKGGGNSFCILTTLHLKTYPSTKVWVGNNDYDSTQGAAFLDAVSGFAQNGSLDKKASTIPLVITTPGTGVSYRVTRFYDGETDKPDTWANFTAPRMNPLTDSYQLQPLSTFIASGAAQPPLRTTWRVISSKASREALEIIHAALLEESKGLADTSSVGTFSTFQTITKDFIRQSQLKGGNPQGIDLGGAPYFWTLVILPWVDEKDDAFMEGFADAFVETVNARLGQKGLGAKYLYLNYAGKGQRVFESYGKGNLGRLKGIRERYDPRRVFTDLMPGGWKVAHA